MPDNPVLDAHEVEAYVLSPKTNLPAKSARTLAIETPVAIEFNGIAYAVMMATPADLEDFVVGFAIAERLISTPSDLGQIDAFMAKNGWIIRANVAGTHANAVFERARTRVAESSCGLCGLENLELVGRPLPAVAGHENIDTQHIFAALAALHAHQPLNEATGGAHGAAWVDAGGNIACVREDVGRHNALDKLNGAMARANISPATGFIMTTSRCSYEIVEKTVLAGATTLVTISVPTSIAVERAKACGLSLYALARPDAVLRFA